MSSIAAAAVELIFTAEWGQKPLIRCINWRRSTNDIAVCPNVTKFSIGLRIVVMVQLSLDGSAVHYVGLLPALCMDGVMFAHNVPYGMANAVYAQSDSPGGSTGGEV